MEGKFRVGGKGPQKSVVQPTAWSKTTTVTVSRWPWLRLESFLRHLPLLDCLGNKWVLSAGPQRDEMRTGISWLGSRAVPIPEEMGGLHSDRRNFKIHFLLEPCEKTQGEGGTCYTVTMVMCFEPWL